MYYERVITHITYGGGDLDLLRESSFKEWSEGPIDETRSENLTIARPAFSLEKVACGQSRKEKEEEEENLQGCRPHCSLAFLRCIIAHPG